MRVDQTGMKAPEPIEQLLALARLHQAVYVYAKSVIAECSTPRPLCQCHEPTVGKPDDMDWGICIGCERYVPMTAVVDGNAHICQMKAIAMR